LLIGVFRPGLRFDANRAELFAKLCIYIPIICTPEELLAEDTDDDWYCDWRDTSDS